MLQFYTFVNIYDLKIQKEQSFIVPPKINKKQPHSLLILLFTVYAHQNEIEKRLPKNCDIMKYFVVAKVNGREYTQWESNQRMLVIIRDERT